MRWSTTCSLQRGVSPKWLRPHPSWIGRERPSWSELRRGKRPPTNLSKEPGEWQHGWQYWTSSASDRTFRKSTMLSSQSASNRAHLRMRLSLPITEATFGGFCAPLDPRGLHRAAGRLKKRATLVERMLARVFRESGARVQFNAFLKDMNVGVSATE